jgi:hypothetical protein
MEAKDAARTDGPADQVLLAFLDECGDHSMQPVDPDFPLLLLAVVLCRREVYWAGVLAGLNELKLRFWSHEGVVMHSREIRKQTGEFSFLHDPRQRLAFYAAMSEYVRNAPFDLVVACYHKRQPTVPSLMEHPYAFALRRLLDVIVRHARTHSIRRVHLIAEARGKREDRQLSEWVRAYQGTHDGLVIHLEVRTKSANIAGLQLADLCAYPAARHALGAARHNRAFESVSERLLVWVDNKKDGFA